MADIQEHAPIDGARPQDEARHPGRIIAAVAGLGVLAAGAIGIAVHEGSANSGADPSAQESPWFDVDGAAKASCLEIVDRTGTAETMTVTVDGKKVTLIKPDLGSQQDDRMWQDSMRAPFETGPDPNDVEAEIKAGFCEDAAFAVSTAHVLGNVVYDGKRLADTEGAEWLIPYAKILPESMNDRANYLLGTDLEQSDTQGHMDRYNKHMDLAENLAATLGNLRNGGLQVRPTDMDASYIGGSWIDVAGDGVPELMLGKERFEKAEALVFGAINKDETCVKPILGFNTGKDANGQTNDGDQRPESFVDDCEPETVTTTEPDDQTTTTEHHDQTTTTEHHDDTTTTVVVDDKNPDDDYNNGTTPSNGPGSGGSPGPVGTTSTTAAPQPNPGASTTTTTMATTETTVPTEVYEG